MRITKTTAAGTTGTNVFNFGHAGLQTLAGVATSTSSISVTGATSVPGTNFVGPAVTAQTISETLPTGFRTVSISCSDANSASTGNVNPVASNTGLSSITIPAAAMVAGATVASSAAITCTFTNTSQATVTLKKVVAGTPNDDGLFRLTVSNGATLLGDVSGGNGTTTGTVNIPKGTTISLNEGAATGSNTNNANYTTTFACTNAVGGPLSANVTVGSLAWGNKTINIGAAATGDDLNPICTFTNTNSYVPPVPPTLSCTSTATEVRQLNTANNGGSATVAVGGTDKLWEL